MVSRGFGGTTPYSLAAGGELTFVANVKLEGDAAKRDISTVRVPKENYVQYIAKPVEVSATMEAVAGGISVARARCGPTCSASSHPNRQRVSRVRKTLDRRVLPEDVLDIVRAFQRRAACHLGGGAALSGAHLAHRLSGDVDLFCHEHQELRDVVRWIRGAVFIDVVPAMTPVFWTECTR